MKNISKLFGIIAITALIGFAFFACDDSLGGLPPPPEAPAFTDGVTGVSTQQEAENILAKFAKSGALDDVNEAAKIIIKDNIIVDTDEWDFKDKWGEPDAEIDVIVSSTSKQTVTGSPSLTSENGPDIKVGDSAALNIVKKAAIRLRETMEAGDGADKISFIKGSSYIEDTSAALKMTITSIANNDPKASINMSGEMLYQAGFTIKDNSSNKGIRVQLNCSMEISFALTNQDGELDPDMIDSIDEDNVKYDGYLKVYGADTAPLIDMIILDAESYVKALTLLGMAGGGDNDGGGDDDGDDGDNGDDGP